MAKLSELNLSLRKNVIQVDKIVLTADWFGLANARPLINENSSRSLKSDFRVFIYSQKSEHFEEKSGTIEIISHGLLIYNLYH